MPDLVQRSEDLGAEVLGELVAAGVLGVFTTDNPLEIPAALANGPVVLVNPPKVRYITYDARDVTWELFVIAGPPADRRAAWARISPIVDALAVPLNIDTAAPAAFEHPGMAAYPAYVLTFTETL